MADGCLLFLVGLGVLRAFAPGATTGSPADTQHAGQFGPGSVGPNYLLSGTDHFAGSYDASASERAVSISNYDTKSTVHCRRNRTAECPKTNHGGTLIEDTRLAMGYHIH